MAVDQTNPDNIYLGALYGMDNSMLRSTDGGVSWESTFPDGSEIANTTSRTSSSRSALDAADQKHIIVTFHIADCKRQVRHGLHGRNHGRRQLVAHLQRAVRQLERRRGAVLFLAVPKEWIIGTTQNGVFYTADCRRATWGEGRAGTDRMLYKTSDGRYYHGSDYGMQRSLTATSGRRSTARPTRSRSSATASACSRACGRTLETQPATVLHVGRDRRLDVEDLPHTEDGQRRRLLGAYDPDHKVL